MNSLEKYWNIKYFHTLWRYAVQCKASIISIIHAIHKLLKIFLVLCKWQVTRNISRATRSSKETYLTTTKTQFLNERRQKPWNNIARICCILEKLLSKNTSNTRKINSKIFCFHLPSHDAPQAKSTIYPSRKFSGIRIYIWRVASTESNSAGAKVTFAIGPIWCFLHAPVENEKKKKCKRDDQIEACPILPPFSRSFSWCISAFSASLLSLSLACNADAHAVEPAATTQRIFSALVSLMTPCGRFLSWCSN